MSSDETPAADAAHPAPPASRRWLGRARSAIGRVSERAHHEAHHYAREALEEAVIDLAPLPRELRFLAGAGYAILIALLVAVLASEMEGQHLPSVTFHNGAEVVRVPAAVLPGAAAAFAVGWAYLLAGATLSSLWVFVPVFILFSLTADACLAGLKDGNGALLVPLPIAAVLGLRLQVRRRPDWRQRPWRLFLIAMAAAATLPVLLAAFDRSRSETAADLSTTMLPLFLLASPLQVLIALELTQGVARLTRRLVVLVRSRFSERALRRVAVPLLLAILVACTAIAPITPNGQALLWPILTALLLLVTSATLMLLRRWTERAAATTIALMIASLPFAAVLAAAFEGGHIAEVAIHATQLVPETFLFAAFLIYHAMTFGPRFAHGDSRAMPRPARPLLYFGLAILVVGYALLALSCRLPATGEPDRSTQEWVNGILFAGLLIAGPPYLAWIAWKRPAELIGGPAGEPRSAKGGEQRAKSIKQ